MEGLGLFSPDTVLPQFSNLFGSIYDWNQLQVMSCQGIAGIIHYLLRSCLQPSQGTGSGIQLTLDKQKDHFLFLPFFLATTT
jgi:hypothetical protein